MFGSLQSNFDELIPESGPQRSSRIDDQLTDPEGSQQFYDGITSGDKTLTMMEGAYHEIFNDLDKERFFTDLIDWLNARS